VTDFQLVLRVVGYIFAACAFLAVAETAIDAWVHQPMAEFLVKRFADLMLVCVSTIGGLLAGEDREPQEAAGLIHAWQRRQMAGQWKRDQIPA
jgi:hypothetical protein